MKTISNIYSHLFQRNIRSTWKKLLTNQLHYLIDCVSASQNDDMENGQNYINRHY